MPAHPVIETDLLVVGAGPAGLFQAFQAGLLGLRVEVIDALPHAGGQCTALYADKPIYDVPGLPVCTGRELTDRLLQQAAPFVEGHLHLGTLVTAVTPACLSDGVDGFDVSTSPAPHPDEPGLRVQTRAIVVASGAGAFLPRGLNLPELNSLRNVHHHLAPADRWAGQPLVIAGGADDALHAVVQLLDLPQHQAPASLTLLHRRAQFQAEPELVARVQAAIDAGQVQLAVGMPTGCTHADGQLTHLDLLGADGQTRHWPCPNLLIQLGLSPKLGPLQAWGLALSRKQVQVDPATMGSSVAGVHAIGDAVTYPGKLRLILCGFHEATLAAYAVAQRLLPEHPAQLLYTTTSPVLHRRLKLG